jgi:hypothetical protein
MKDLIAGMTILLMIIFGLNLAFGANLKRWYGWAQVLSGFLLGFSMGQSLTERMISGIFFALLTMWLGSIVWKRRHW